MRNSEPKESKVEPLSLGLAFPWPCSSRASVLTVIVASSILSRSPSAGASGPSAGQLYTSAVLAQDPYSLYDLQQTSGSTVYDASPNGDNASVSGDGSEEGQTPGPFSGSSFFNFGGQELSPNVPFSADSMTLSAWVNLNSDDGGNNLEFLLGGYGVDLAFGKSGSNFYPVMNVGTCYEENCLNYGLELGYSSANEIPAGKWEFVAWTINLSTTTSGCPDASSENPVPDEQAAIYLDGVEQDSGFACGTLDGYGYSGDAIGNVNDSIYYGVLPTSGTGTRR